MHIPSHPHNVKKCLLPVLLLTLFASGTGWVYAGGEAVIENGDVRVTVDLDTGLYRAEDRVTGTVLFRNATLRLGRWNLSDGKVVKKRSARRERVHDELGMGETLRVTGELHARKRPFSGPIELELAITLYENRTAIILGAGLKNGLSATENGQVRGIIVKGFSPFAGAELWPADQVRDEAMTLDGHGAYGFGWKPKNDSDAPGLPKHERAGNAVVQGLNRVSENNLLLTYRTGKARRAFVAGGLTYYDYLKRVRVKAGDNGNVVADTEAYDPVGRVVKMGDAYYSPDRIYVDLMTANPFTALESYAAAAAKAQQARPNLYNFPTLCMWYVMYSGGGGRCNTVAAVRQMELVSKTKFLHYAPVGIRLVPDTYLGNTEQGWWDDEHWRRYNWYQKPYDTSEKFCRAVRELGGLPFTYVQTGMPSDDFAEAHPDWMLHNSIKYLDVARDHEKPYVRFDYSDPGFQAHMSKVWKNLGKAGLAGVMFDYAATGFAGEGGLDDPAMTATAAYRKIFELTREGLGPKAHIHERNLGEVSSPTSLPHERLPYTDATLGLVDSQRIEADSSSFTAAQVARAALRWYKTRVFFMYDMDSKSMLLRKSGGKVEQVPDPATRRRSILTMMYVTSGRVLLADSFEDCREEVLHELSRIYPMHEERRTACPVDLFLPSAAACPRVFRYAVTPDWYQVTLFNPDLDHPAPVSAPLSGDTVTDGALGLDRDSEYYLYDFWNDAFAGRLKGSDTLEQQLRGGEARMLSVHKVQAAPQFISSNRHVMQGFVDLLVKPTWAEEAKSLSGSSKVIEKDPYELVFACNGRTPKGAVVSSGRAAIGWKDRGQGLAVLTLKTKKTTDIQWTVLFE